MDCCSEFRALKFYPGEKNLCKNRGDAGDSFVLLSPSDSLVMVMQNQTLLLHQYDTYLYFICYMLYLCFSLTNVNINVVQYFFKKTEGLFMISKLKNSFYQHN